MASWARLQKRNEFKIVHTISVGVREVCDVHLFWCVCLSSEAKNNKIKLHPNNCTQSHLSIINADSSPRAWAALSCVASCSKSAAQSSVNPPPGSNDNVKTKTKTSALKPARVGAAELPVIRQESMSVWMQAGCCEIGR